ncbi:MAG: hypothetical protein HYU28_06525 [Actinobacteria bacterium]|nr:hypothetical protein [Actinomycetota bacterium]
MLPDGQYDAFVVWAERDDEGRLSLDLTITAGEFKGEVVSITAPAPSSGAQADPIRLTGLPCMLVVEDGQPRVEE